MRYRSPAEQVLAAIGRVTGVATRDGTLPADVVVANADPLPLYRDLLAKADRPRNTDRALRRRKHSKGLYLHAPTRTDPGAPGA